MVLSGARAGRHSPTSIVYYLLVLHYETLCGLLTILLSLNLAEIETLVLPRIEFVEEGVPSFQLFVLFGQASLLG